MNLTKSMRVSIVTGGASGIGRATVDALLAAGESVVVVDLPSDALREIEQHPRVLAVGGDVTDAATNELAVALAEGEFGGLDALVNNAGIAGPTGNLEDLSPDDWRRCIDVCLTSQFLCSRQAIPMIKASGGGTIVNMASAAAKHGYAYRTPYSAAKFGVVGLTQSLAKELGPDNIRVNALLPGIIEGPRMEGVIRDRAEATGVNIDDMRNTYLKNISLRRMTSPKDVATTVAFLVSDLGFNLSGQSLGVDGNVETL